ncbi:hypothetical protein EDC01DRAFT_630410 [Geopyxis carbonaria]|nr:hypothetical protein EDC01DRAFT_630410 [Geopyxis carbonaria]
MRSFILLPLFATFGFFQVQAEQGDTPDSVDSEPPYDPSIDISEVELQPLFPADVNLDDLPTLNLTDFGLSESDGGRSHVECDTTWASPRLEEADRIINAIKSRGDNWCYNTNASKSQCSMIASIAGAQVSLCGTTFKIPCYTAGVMVREIKDGCKWGVYSGGRNMMLSGRRVQLH